MANFEQNNESPMRRRFQEQFGNQELVPLPATQMMRRGAPATPVPRMPNVQNPFRFTQRPPTGGGPGGGGNQAPGAAGAPGLPQMGNFQMGNSSWLGEERAPNASELLQNYLNQLYEARSAAISANGGAGGYQLGSNVAAFGGQPPPQTSGGGQYPQGPQRYTTGGGQPNGSNQGPTVAPGLPNQPGAAQPEWWGPTRKSGRPIENFEKWYSNPNHQRPYDAAGNPIPDDQLAAWFSDPANQGTGGYGGNPVNSQDYNTTGNADLDAMRAQMRARFPLGGSDLSNQQIQNDAAAAFQAYITAAGGSPDLRAEIGDARFINRLQEFLGKGDTLNQSGVIHVGNGVTINSLRSLGDFNQPGMGGGGPVGMPMGGGFDSGVGGAGGGGGGGFSGGYGDLIPGTGKGHPGSRAQYVGGRSAGASSRALQRLAQTGGIDPNLTFEVEKSLRESMERTRTSEEAALMEGLASRRITGGGVEAQERGLLGERLAAGVNTGLRDFGTALAMQGSQNQLAAAQSLASNALTRRGQDLSMIQSQWSNALQQQQINNNFALGQGGLAIQNLVANTDFMNSMVRNRIDLGTFMNAINNAGSGDVTQLLSLLLGSADTISRGSVGRR